MLHHMHRLAGRCGAAAVAASTVKARAHSESAPPLIEGTPKAKEAVTNTQPPSTDSERRQRFLAQRRCFLTGGVDDESANRVVSELLWLESAAPGVPIELYISSNGGELWGGFAIFDVMRAISSPVRTICLGRCRSMAALLLAAGEPGERYAGVSARLMIHQPSWGSDLLPHPKGADHLAAQAAESQRQREHWAATLAELTGQPAAALDARMATDVFLTAVEARELGLVDHIMRDIDGDHVSRGGQRSADSTAKTT